MSVPKAKALLTVCAALLLCGCGQALSEREIVRAVFFARQQGAYSACLLLADQNAESDGVQYKTASARGNTAAQALHLAEDALPGRLYYGLLDLAALPSGCDWADAQTLGTLLYDKAQPAPELSVFVLDTADHSWAADAASLYEDMKAVEREYDLHCGLQQLLPRRTAVQCPPTALTAGMTLRCWQQTELPCTSPVCRLSWPRRSAGRRAASLRPLRVGRPSVTPRSTSRRRIPPCSSI